MTSYQGWVRGALGAAVVLTTAAAARADIVMEWNAHAAQTIVTVGGQAPPRAFIRLAMVHLAIYDAVNAIEGRPFTPYGRGLKVNYPASREAAVATAAHDVLTALFPAQQTDLDAKYAASLAAIPDGARKVNGISVGQRAAAAILALRANDGRDNTVTYVPLSGPGAWAPTPPALLPALSPETPYVQPFALRDASQFRPTAPPSLDSRKWARGYNAVKALGPAVGSTRTPEQTDIGRFWADNPPLQWNRAWRALSEREGLGVMDNARYFAMLTTVSADALIGCWEAKYFYNFWRPVTAIRAGDTDGTDATSPDPAWIGLVPTPNHPEYPGAHGCLSAGSTETLKRFFGTDRIALTIDSNVPNLLMPVRSYARFSDVLDEVLAARTYGGMHYPSSSRTGARLGKRVSRFVTQHFFRETHRCGRDHKH